MQLTGQLEPVGWGMQDYENLVKGFSPEPIENLRKRFPQAIEVLLTHENGMKLFNKPQFIFDIEDWRMYIHRCTTEDESGHENNGSEVVSVLAYNAKFEAMPAPMQINHVALLVTEISQGVLDEGIIIRSQPGHVAMMFEKY